MSCLDAGCPALSCASHIRHVHQLHSCAPESFGRLAESFTAAAAQADASLASFTHAQHQVYRAAASSLMINVWLLTTLSLPEERLKEVFYALIEL